MNNNKCFILISPLKKIRMLSRDFFFKKTWDIIGANVIATIQDFFRHEKPFQKCPLTAAIDL